MKKTATVMFDFDGVIVDSYDCYLACWVEACRKTGLVRLGTAETFLKLFESNFREGLTRLGLGAPKTDELFTEFLAGVEGGFAPRGLQPGMLECIESVSRVADIHVVTSNATEVVRGYLERENIPAVRSVLGIDVEPSKVLKIRRIMADRESGVCFYVGDTLGDMMEAREAGARAIAATWGWHSVETLRKGGPDYVVGSPTELARLVNGAYR